MEYLIENRQYLEILYFISGPLTLIGVAIALIQLYLFKRDLNTKYRRESMQLTLEMFHPKSLRLSELSRKMDDAFELEEIEIPNIEVKEFLYESIQNEPWTKKFQDSIEAYNASIDYLCEVDHIAQVVLSGLADEEFAFKCQGSYFVEVVNEAKPMILAIRNSDNSEVFRDTIDLYNLWNAKVKKQKLLAEHKYRERELESLSTHTVPTLK
ncbi:hypothetical protein K6Q96_09025 [Grimontia kaedaensis]|uniref:DUF4760 domain-containing protein n=1 Tax=Grimontia kaedaensis TaxID=2872157 RepID=A0ABY4WNI7_9GAMM|nr:hypothetical protein [Grimontia kaedaensis]USH01083.1 hypothetical protein K6Q96_09025 [Grimontia kaedaensis]